ncbi:MAG TPA: hypothetical protein VFB59_03855, partial [Candidatus Saccharimonadales bacterium]|nr:hypothetical protein [Candidatus Saccharimonadales bacterium]
FGGEHDFDPENVLFNQTANALDYFINLVGDDTHKAILIVEGEERHVPVSLSDKHIFAMHGEIGMAEAIAKRAGIRVVGAEPLPGLDVLAQKYSSKEVFHYLSLRLLPQWYLIDSKYRNPPNVYIASVFRNRPHLERLKYLADVDDYVQALLREDYFSLPYGVSMPDRFECLKQTTYEFIATIPKEDRTITQHIAFEHNLQRDRRLYYDITRYLHEGYM